MQAPIALSVVVCRVTISRRWPTKVCLTNRLMMRWYHTWLIPRFYETMTSFHMSLIVQRVSLIVLRKQWAKLFPVVIAMKQNASSDKQYNGAKFEK